MSGRSESSHPIARQLSELVGLPKAQTFELPSSWLMRAALSQGARPKELLEFMGLSLRTGKSVDPDLRMMSEVGLSALRSADPGAVLPVAGRIFSELRRLDPKGEVLLRGKCGRARARFCPLCLGNQAVPHIELHWRFGPWVHCPVHECLMEDACPHCHGFVFLPFDMAGSGAGNRGIAYLSECQHCGRRLRDVSPIQLKAMQISEFDQCRMSNGRALMAALYQGRMWIDGKSKGHPSRNTKYLRTATFWRPGAWYTADGIRAKAQLAARASAVEHDPVDFSGEVWSLRTESLPRSGCSSGLPGN